MATASLSGPKPPITKMRPLTAATATSWRAVGIGASEIQSPGLMMSTGAFESVVLPRQPARTITTSASTRAAANHERTRSSNPASSSIGTPRRRASSALLPGASPTTT